jgi:hypothetical protein
MSPHPTYDILMFGHFAKDRNVVDGQGKIESGGAVYFAALPRGVWARAWRLSRACTRTIFRGSTS